MGPDSRAFEFTTGGRNVDKTHKIVSLKYAVSQMQSQEPLLIEYNGSNHYAFWLRKDRDGVAHEVPRWLRLKTPTELKSFLTANPHTADAGSSAVTDTDPLVVQVRRGLRTEAQLLEKVSLPPPTQQSQQLRFQECEWTELMEAAIVHAAPTGCGTRLEDEGWAPVGAWTHAATVVKRGARCAITGKPMNKFDELVHDDGYALSKKFHEFVLVPPLQSRGLGGIICHAEPDGRCAYHLGDMMQLLLEFDSSNGEGVVSVRDDGLQVIATQGAHQLA